MSRYPSFAHVFPFALFLGFVALRPVAPLSEFAYQAVWLAAGAASLIWAARLVLDFRVSRPVATVAIGVAVFAVWIAPDLVAPGYRQALPFSNFLTGVARSSLSEAGQRHTGILILRTARAVIIVPIVEELFWRAWLMRWIISPNFQKIALGTYTAGSFWLVAVLFASEHGAYWDVGLIAGIVYNWWMIRTRSVGDLILAHAVTNGCLSAYVLAAGKWEYWL